MNTQEREFFTTVKILRGIGYGRMMQIISEEWHKSDPVGAMMVGECYGTFEKKRERCKKEGHDVMHGTNWDWCDRCGAKIDPDTGKESL